MGRKVSFQIEVKMYNHGKKQFDISFQQFPFVPNDPKRTAEMIRKNEGFGYKTSRSLSHFDKNQLEVDVCRMMYVALNQISIRDFKTSISENIVKYGKTRRSFKNAVGCEREVIFRKRFTDDEMTSVVQTYFSKLDKNTYGYLRAKIEQPGTNDLHLVNQEFNETVQELTRQASISRLDGFNDSSEDVEDLNESSEIVSEESPIDNPFERQNNVVKDEDIDPSHSSKISEKSEAKLQRQNNTIVDEEVNVISLRNRDVPRFKSEKSGDKSEESKDGSSPSIREQLEQSHKSQDDSSVSSESSYVDDINRESINAKLKEEFMNRLNRKDIKSDKTDTMEEVAEIQKPKKRKRVIVLIETIECSKCKNDINTEIFLRLLNNKSFMI